MRMRRICAVLVLVAGIAAGCSNDAKMAFGLSYPTMQALATKLGCTNVTEDDLSPSATNQIRIGPEMRSAGGHCTLNGKDMKVALFADSAHMNQWMGMGRTIGCAFAKGFGITKMNMAAGPNWVITPSDNLDEAGAKQIATVLGGQAQVVNCS